VNTLVNLSDKQNSHKALHNKQHGQRIKALVVPLVECTGYTNRLVRVAAAVGLKVVAGMRAGLAVALAAVGQPKALAQCVSV
jgi:hypothetical protein